MKLIKLAVKGISYSHSQNGAYALILDEVEGARKLPIVIGAFEAQSIAIAIEEEISPPRPLTHDLFKTFADRYQIVLKEVIIYKLIDGVFYSHIIYEQNDEEQVFEARTSDAIALAIRSYAPIYAYDTVMDKAGIILSGDQINHEEEEDDDDLYEHSIIDDENGLKKYSLDELNKMMQSAIESEDYEKAALLRDEITKR
ncbi:MAG: bifunctional nuclease family protein [Flavobacteriaceae bacterium]|jgi:bifunctional DNase/RNase|nr:bifunctional nuclease family protein [Flavobacteriaceae bacterium]